MRIVGGETANEGAYGFYWTGTPAGSTYGHEFRFESTIMVPAYTSSTYSIYERGRSIRCVRP